MTKRPAFGGKERSASRYVFGHKGVRVLETRVQRDGRVRRRYEAEDGTRFTTLESPVSLAPAEAPDEPRPPTYMRAAVKEIRALPRDGAMAGMKRLAEKYSVHPNTLYKWARRVARWEQAHRKAV